MTMPSRSLVVTLSLWLGLSSQLVSPLLAHGGQVPQPSTPVGPPPIPWSPAPYGQGGSGSGTGTGATTAAGARRPALGPGSGVDTSAGSRRTALVRGSSGRSGASTPSAQSPTVQALEGWEPWWAQNKDRFLDLRGRLLIHHNVSGSPGLLTGRGRKATWRTSRRADPGLVDGRIVPVLLHVLASTDDRDILDSAVLALARSAAPHRAGDVLDAIIPLLAHRELSVQSSAALSLGVLASDEASELLLSLARDDSRGRKAIGGGPVPRQVRAHAAFALGLVADARSVYRMLQLISRLPSGERDVKAAALAGLAMLPTDHNQLDMVQSVLVEMLADRRLDPMVASFVPTTLAKLQRRGTLPALLHAFRQRDTDNLVRQSVALALGRLATLQDVFAVEALAGEIDHGKDRLTRHFAFISLAQMGAAGDWSEVHADLARLLGRELQGKGKSSEHRSWAGLAAALLGRAHPEAQPLLLERLRDAYLNERAPSYKGAFALALGLLRDGPSSANILADFRDIADPGFRAHAALALGFLDTIECTSELSRLCVDRSTPEGLRLSSATALGLLGDRSAVPLLVEALKATGSLSVRAALAKAVGLIGDKSAVEPLLAMSTDAKLPALSRAFACVAVGLLAERTPLPFNEPLKADGNYHVPVDAIQELLAIL